MKLKVLTAAALVALLGVPAYAGDAATPAWNDIKAAVYGDRPIVANAAGIVTLEAPRRAKDDRTVPVTAKASFSDGRSVKSLTLIADENPTPVSAVFKLDRPQQKFGVAVNMRLNGPTPIHAVVEASDGQLYMAEALVKTSGLGACAAPPVTDAQVALATLGEMELHGRASIDTSAKIRPQPVEGQVRLDLKHPQHSGLQMNQITLLYIPARYVQTIEVWGGEEKFFTMEGSISLSEDPSIAFDLPNGNKGTLKVRLTDTEEAMFERVFQLGGV